MKHSRRITKEKAPYASFKNKYLVHLINQKKKYLLALLILMALAITATNFIADEPLLKGGESYYYARAAEEGSYSALAVLVSFFSERVLFLIPPLLAVFSLLILFKLSEKIKLKSEFIFFFTLFLLLSPTFVYSFTTLSAYSLFFLLVLVGFWLVVQEKEKIRIFSLIPFIIATCIDLFSTFLLLFLLLAYLLAKRNEKTSNKSLFIASGVTFLLLIINKFVFNLPVLIGPFHSQKIIPDLLSDLGGLSGVSFFLLILALIGITAKWKKKEFYAAYLLLPIIILAYLFNTQTIFYLSLLIVFFAAAGCLKLFERRWTLILLKKLTFFVLVLGILFSTLSYLERMPAYPPSNADLEALTWIKENTPKEAIVLSDLKNSYFINYFSNRKPLGYFQESNNKLNLTQQIFSSVYTQDLFPLLEKNNISIIYVNQDMKEALPKEQGFLFLLKNEKFKLIHSYRNSEVWTFKKE